MTDPSPVHIPVMLEEVIHWVAPEAGAVIVDGTLGGGGHTRALAQRVTETGGVIALDRDENALIAAEQRLAGLPVTVAHANFAELSEILADLAVESVDGIVLDLGLSSDQLADPDRGFSFDATGPLDLRFDVTSGEPAWRLLDRLSAPHLADLIYRYGEERCSRRIARAVVECRRKSPIRTADQLAQLVRRCVPRSSRGRGPGGRAGIDPATRTFQALRIAVNEELKSLEVALRRMPDCLRPGGRLVIISFHSLEDRRVKEAFRDDPRLEALTKKPVRASTAETAQNPRARSAKLRAARRV